MWWVTLVDATLVRYHPRDYEAALASEDVRRRKTEQALEGLRYVRNQLGKSADPAGFVCLTSGEGTTAWTWRPQPEPQLGELYATGPPVGVEPVPRLPGAARRAWLARTFTRAPTSSPRPRAPPAARPRRQRQVARFLLPACITWRDGGSPRARWPGTVPRPRRDGGGAARERAAPAARMPGKTRSPGQIRHVRGAAPGRRFQRGGSFRRRRGGHRGRVVGHRCRCRHHPPLSCRVRWRPRRTRPRSTQSCGTVHRPGSDPLRGQLGYSADPGDFIQPAPGAPAAAWTWRSVPPPSPQRGTVRDTSPYREYRTQLAERLPSEAPHPDRRLPLPHPHRHRQSQAWYCRTGPVSAYRGFPPCNASTALTRYERRRAGDCLASARGSVLPAPVLRIMRAHSRYLPSRRGNG